MLSWSWRFCAGLSPQRLKILHSHEFHSLPAGFGYQHEISEASNTTDFDTAVDARDLRCCVVCGKEAAGGPRPGVQRANIIGKTEDPLWDFLKNTGFVPSIAKSVVHEPRNGINLCVSHHSDFDGYRCFIQRVPSDRVFVFVNISQNQYLEQFHGKTVALDPNHNHSPFPAPFLIQEMRTSFTLGALTDQSLVHYLPFILLLTTVEAAEWQVLEVEVIPGSVLVEVVERPVLVADPHPQK
ncbi:hypothetical protein JOM56_007726 [Amanita muscaria]